MMIESEENFKESLRANAPKAALLQQNAAVTIEGMPGRKASSTIDLLDEQCAQLLVANKKGNGTKEEKRRRRKEQMEREVAKLTHHCNTMQIQALFQGHNTTAYPDRNLVDEGRKELEAFRMDARGDDNAAGLYNDHLQRVAGLRDLTEIRKRRRSLFGAAKGDNGGEEPRKMSVTKGILAISAASLGVNGTAAMGGVQKKAQEMKTELVGGNVVVVKIRQPTTTEEMEDGNADGDDVEAATATKVPSIKVTFGIDDQQASEGEKFIDD